MLSKRHGAPGHHGVSCFHYLRSSDPPLNPMECENSYTMHIAPCGRTRRGDRLGLSPRSPIRANCLHLNQKKWKFLYDRANVENKQNQVAISYQLWLGIDDIDYFTSMPITAFVSSLATSGLRSVTDSSLCFISSKINVRFRIAMLIFHFFASLDEDCQICQIKTLTTAIGIPTMKIHLIQSRWGCIWVPIHMEKATTARRLVFAIFDTELLMHKAPCGRTRRGTHKRERAIGPHLLYLIE